MERQELNIFVPKLDLGIEYHGKQSFESVETWGGEKALKDNKRRDREKKQKCEENEVEILIFTYKEKDLLDENYAAEKINKAFKVS